MSELILPKTHSHYSIKTATKGLKSRFSLQQSDRLNVTFIVQTQIHLTINDWQLKPYGFQPLAVRLLFLVHLNLIYQSRQQIPFVCFLDNLCRKII